MGIVVVEEGWKDYGWDGMGWDGDGMGWDGDGDGDGDGMGKRILDLEMRCDFAIGRIEWVFFSLFSFFLVGNGMD